MLIQQQQEGSKGSFFVEEDNKRLAEMTYSIIGNETMIIDHTEVDDALRGKNVGYQLVHTAMEYARTNNMKIIPLCPFARSVFIKKADEFADVWKK